MAVLYDTAGQHLTKGTGAQTINTNLASDDAAIVLLINASGNSAFSLTSKPSGWTEVFYETGGNDLVSCYVKIGSGAWGTTAVTMSGPWDWEYTWASFSGVLTFESNEAAGANPPSLTASRALTADDLWIAVGAMGAWQPANTYSPLTPSGYTSRRSYSENNSNGKIAEKAGAGSDTEDPGATMSADAQTTRAATIALMGPAPPTSFGFGTLL